MCTPACWHSSVKHGMQRIPPWPPSISSHSASGALQYVGQVAETGRPQASHSSYR